MGNSIKKATLIVALCLVGASFSAVALGCASAMALGETKDERRLYGSCWVYTSYDDFTDYASHHLGCEGSGSNSGVHFVGIVRWSDPRLVPYIVMLKSGIQYQQDGTVDVRYRFDEGKVFRETWEWSSDTSTAGKGSKAIFLDSYTTLNKKDDWCTKSGKNDRWLT